MITKTEKQFFFEVKLNWLSDTKALISAKDASGLVYVGTPPAFGGEGTPWTPEHLFLSAISSCYMTTYLTFAKKLGFKIANFQCEAMGQIQLIEGKYKFTKIDLYPKIFIKDGINKEKANLAAEKTHKYCLITNSVNATVFYHSEVLVNKYL